jgi:C4-dicarboxylate-specific signal transduction histidine kinase
MSTMKKLRQKTRRAAKAPRLRAPTRSKLQDKLTEPQDELTEVSRHQAAISEVLRAIASSPHDLQPILQTIFDSTVRLCRAEAGAFRLVEEAGLRLGAYKLSSAVLKEEYSLAMLLEHGSFLGRRIASKSPVHIPDIAEVEANSAGEADHRVAAVKAGFRTVLFVPMLRNDELVGSFSIGRRRIEPFTENEIELVTDFAAQVAIALEITRRERQLRELQMELAHVNRVATIGHLTASITHEVNQPLAAARNNLTAALNFLDRTPADLVDVREALACAVKDNDRAGTVVGRIRALMQKAPKRTDRVDINEAVLEVIELTRGEALKNGVSVKTKFAKALPIITGDRVQLQQVVLNLILNALQATGAVSEGAQQVLITTSQTESNDLYIRVQDTGPGLSPETLSRLFEPFYTTKPDGMGMGLSICRSIIEAHGGRLSATQHKDPRGALFQFTIPAT